MLRQTVGTVPLESANSSNTFRYNYPEYGIDGNMSTNAKFIAYDKDSFWYQVHFDGVYCVDQVMTLDLEVYSHSWTCTETGCGDPCQGFMCKYVKVTVLKDGWEFMCLTPLERIRRLSLHCEFRNSILFT